MLDRATPGDATGSSVSQIVYLEAKKVENKQVDAKSKEVAKVSTDKVTPAVKGEEKSKSEVVQAKVNTEARNVDNKKEVVATSAVDNATKENDKTTNQAQSNTIKAIPNTTLKTDSNKKGIVYTGIGVVGAIGTFIFIRKRR